MGRYDRLRRRSGAGGQILSGDPAILADAPGRRTDAELFWDSAEDRAAGGGRAGFPDPRAARPWRRRTDQSVRNRIAGPDIFAGNSGPCRRAGRGIAGKASFEPPKTRTSPRVNAIALLPGGRRCL